MSEIISPKSTEAAANGSGAATNVSSSSTVRAVNTSASAATLVSLTNAAGTVLGTATLTQSESVLIHKNQTDKVFAGAATVLFSAVDIRG
tara:strand:- start:894 stop:1163 length:270 start_codon:yes stop_codon:yes gene_type:complete